MSSCCMDIDSIPGITVSAPGSLMLLGEHAVLHGHRALVCAINRCITVHLSPLEREEVRIESSLGNYMCPLRNLVDHPSLRFVIQAVQQHADQVTSGFELRIDSEFSPEIGFGSSAAVTVATHAAILAWMKGEAPEKTLLFDMALETVHAVQGRGSGADLAASVFGGIVGYTMEPTFEHVPVTMPLTAVYCGYKMPTPDVIMKVEQTRIENPTRYARIFSDIDTDVGEAIDRLRNHDWPAFGQIMGRNQQRMNEMGVNTPELQDIVDALQKAPDVFGAKISGSGLGDCAVGIGYADLNNMDYPGYHLEITPVGVEYHE